MTRLALGTAQFGQSYGIANLEGKVTRPAVKVMLELAANNGIDTLDTAIAYGDSEASLGEAGVRNFKLVTKLPAVPDTCSDVAGWVHEQVAASLARVGTDTLYGLLLHCPHQLLEVHGKVLYQALQKLKETGQVEKIGLSIYSPNELILITQQYPIDLVQAPFNLIDRRLHSSGWLQKLKDNGVEVHTRSAFLQGLLLMPQAAIPVKFSPWADLWSKWHYWLAKNQISALQACINFPFSIPEIDRVVVGAESVNQLQQIINVAASGVAVDLPDLCCEDENLINPARWSHL
jgi:aryl-alcohol dehydrogenase-like predicted oxidoreductase